jgi:hypothetical protein
VRKASLRSSVADRGALRQQAYGTLDATLHDVPVHWRAGRDFERRCDMLVPAMLAKRRKVRLSLAKCSSIFGSPRHAAACYTFCRLALALIANSPTALELPLWPDSPCAAVLFDRRSARRVDCVPRLYLPSGRRRPALRHSRCSGASFGPAKRKIPSIRAAAIRGALRAPATVMHAPDMCRRAPTTSSANEKP